MQSEVEGGPAAQPVLGENSSMRLVWGGCPFRVEKKSVVTGKKEKIKTPFA